MLLYVVVGIVICLLTWFGVSCALHYRLRTFGGTRDVPVAGEQPDWILGNVRKLGLIGGIPLHRGLITYQKRFGDIFQFFLGSSHYLVLGLPEHVQHVLSHRHIYELSASLQKRFRLLVPNSLLCLTGETHRRHARVILPMLKKNRAMSCVPHISDATDLLLEQWESAYKQQPQQQHDGFKLTNVLRDMQALTLDLIGEIIYAESCQSIPKIAQQQTQGNNKRSQPITTLAQATTVLVERFSSITMLGIPPWIARYGLKFDSQYQQARKVLISFIDAQIAASSDAEVTSAAEQVNILRRLVGSLAQDRDATSTSTISNDNNELSRDEVVDELILLSLAGYETTATALSWFIVYLSKNPQVQKRIKDEMRKVIPQQEGKPPPLSQSQLDALEYMDCVVKETMRLVPSTPGITRTAICDDVIDGIQIKAGQEIFLTAYSLQVDPRYWRVDPAKFDPDRFFGENAPDKEHHPYAYAPFGGGHHACTGQELARVELKTIMTRLMQRVTFHDTPENNIKEVQQVVCIPTNVCVRVTWD